MVEQTSPAPSGAPVGGPPQQIEQPPQDVMSLISSIL